MYEKIDKLNECHLDNDYMLINIVLRQPLILPKSPVLYIKIVELFIFLLRSFPTENNSDIPRDASQVQSVFLS